MANILTFANDTLTDANIYGGIHYICDLNTGDEFSIGNTASAYVSFVTDVQLPLYTKDAVNGTFVWEQDSVTRGKFYITEVTRDKDKYMVTAYDAMILLETSVSALSLSFPLTVSAAASSIATYIGCAISGTINNGTLTADSIEDTTTCRTVLGWVAEASGCSVKIDSSDHLCFMYYTDSGITVSASDYKEDGLNVADYTCAAIDNVTILDMAGMTHATAGSGTNSLFIMGNPFMYEATNTEAATILSLVEDFEYAPFTCEMFEENGLEVGTIATFGTTTTLVMHIESGEGGAVASAVGSDSRAELNKSLDIMINEALSAASNAQDQVDALNLHFWYTATGSEAGAHIAEVSKPTFEANPSGGNLLSSSNGIAVRDGLTELATFGANGARVGKDDEYNVYIDTNGINMNDGAATRFQIYSGASGSGTKSYIKTDGTSCGAQYESYVGGSGATWIGMRVGGNNNNPPSAYVQASRGSGLSDVDLNANGNGKTSLVNLHATSSSASITVESHGYVYFNTANLYTDSTNFRIRLNTDAVSGVDYDLYTAIVALSWQNDVIV